MKVVTLDGVVIAKNGNMTGGTFASDRETSRASHWDDKELVAAQRRRDELLAVRFFFSSFINNVAN
ncbi:hypothetical protein EON66_09500 [archaeon]|nr:MAG: hypothetical protein EON66_09500 [archaeon]